MTKPEKIHSNVVAAAALTFGTIVIEEGIVYWTERRPLEGGRTLIVTEKGSLTPPDYNVASRVHEYGGKAFTVHKGVIYFVNNRDQCVYVQEGSSVRRLTQEGVRFADLCYTPRGLVAVAEKGPDNFLVMIDLASGDYHTIDRGHDFYASPALSPDGTKLLWLTWDSPHMPWDETAIYVAHLDGSQKKCVVQGASHFQPSWSPNGELYYVSDKTGWWNLYREGENICPMDAEFGLPQWVFGMSTYAFLEDRILCTYCVQGTWSLALLNPQTKKLTTLESPGTYFTQIRAEGTLSAYLRGSPTEPLSVISQDRILAAPPLPTITPTVAQNLAFPSNSHTAYGYLYTPDELPAPLLIKAHGGPTGQTTNVFNLGIQYWTSRGFAVLDVNYSGSTGYGRAYRESLKGQWGLIDVADCLAGARYLIEKGIAHPHKVAITGGSAGGFTALSALIASDLFAAGASYFGITDLALLVADTHKLEACYLQELIGPDLKGRSPITHVDQLKVPVIFFQGLDDKVVPPSQTETLFHALQKRGLPTKLVTYPGEQHGFRKASTIADCLEQELAFYLSIFIHKSPQKIGI